MNPDEVLANVFRRLLADAADVALDERYNDFDIIANAHLTDYEVKVLKEVMG